MSDYGADGMKFETEREKAAALAWFISAEGCITLSASSQGGLRPFVAVTNTDLSLLKTIQAIVGGHIQEKRGKAVKLAVHSKKAWIWSIGAKKSVLEFLQFIEPFLPSKREQAALVIEFCRTRAFRTPYTAREKQIAREIRVLNKRGR